MDTTAAEPAQDTGPSEDKANGIDAAPSGNDLGQDHPEGVEIRRQVEYYFSDENLPSDLFLLRLCGGRDNLPVPIGNICGFKKMRKYKPRKLVVAALRQSAFLEVSADGKTIQRKIPLRGKCLLDSDFFDDDEIAHDPRTRKPVSYPVPPLPQTMVKNPQGLSKNMLKPTGFEKAYVEPPQTPDEAIEEEALYDPDRSFVERIEIAIQRFKQSRRMHQMYALVFDKLMRFGGVDSCPRMHQGLSKKEMADMGQEELVRALATHTVPWDRSDTKKWVVDFVGVGQAFLSSWYPEHYSFALSKTQNACQVLRSFYNYLLYHKVCPEYDDQLQAARKVYDDAEQQLPMVDAVSRALPGDFNKSASVMFGGAGAGLYAGAQAWAEESRDQGISMEEIGMRDEEARIKFMTGVAVLGSDAQYEKSTTTGFKILSKASVGLEVVSIQAPDDHTKDAYIEQSKALQHKLGQLEPLGKLKCKSWYLKDYDEWDLPMDNTKYPNGKPYQPEGVQYEFWIEEAVLENCFVGMKLEAKVFTLDDGLTILDEVSNVVCSFFTWIPNELWMERKPKEVKWLKRDVDEDEGVEVDAGVDKKESKDEDGDVDEFDDE